MLKISHARLQHSVNQELPGLQAGFREGRRARDQIENICWIIEEAIPEKKTAMPTKAHLVQAVVFPVVVCGCESWAIKEAERQRIDAFELWCCRRLLRVP